jgi:hypothetical protein
LSNIRQFKILPKWIILTSAIITHNEVIECYDKVILYLQRRKKNYVSNDEDIKFIKKFKKKALRERFGSTKQISLDNFVRIE